MKGNAYYLQRYKRIQHYIADEIMMYQLNIHFSHYIYGVDIVNQTPCVLTQLMAAESDFSETKQADRNFLTCCIIIMS